MYSFCTCVCIDVAVIISNILLLGDYYVSISVCVWSLMVCLGHLILVQQVSRFSIAGGKYSCTCDCW